MTAVNDGLFAALESGKIDYDGDGDGDGDGENARATSWR